MTHIKSRLLFLGIIFTLSPLWGQTVGNPAPDFTLNSVNHGSITLSDYQGKVVFLFFFGYS